MFTVFPVLLERWKAGLKNEFVDPLLCPLAMLVVTSLEATELRNVVYETFNVYVPVMLFQTAMMEELPLGDFFLTHIKAAHGYRVRAPGEGTPATPTRNLSRNASGKLPKESPLKESPPPSPSKSHRKSGHFRNLIRSSSSKQDGIKKRDSMDKKSKLRSARVDSSGKGSRSPLNSPLVSPQDDDSPSPRNPSPRPCPPSPSPGSSSMTPIARSSDKKK